jgi:protease-4
VSDDQPTDEREEPPNRADDAGGEPARDADPPADEDDGTVRAADGAAASVDPGGDDTPPGDGLPHVPADEPTTGDRLARAGLALFGGLVALALGAVLFVVVPASLGDLLGVLLALGAAALGARGAARLAARAFPGYNVAEVSVEGPITRDGARQSPLGAVQGTRADDVVEQVERADDDDAVAALVVKLNTPGGEVVPSDDIRAAVRSFDGPTVAYATDTCASGGYWIASGCDEVWAREASLVGSIGVIGSRPNLSGLADRLGVSYERYAAGQYKDAGNPLKEPTEADREYLQGLIDEFYDDFVERVAAGRDMEPEAVRETEARVFLGREAAERGLVDELGDREAVLDRVETAIGAEPSVRAFDPPRGVRARLGAGARSVARAFGAGVAGAVVAEDGRLRLRR